MKICKSGLCPVENVAKCCIFCDKKAICEDACQFCNNSNCFNIQEIENSLAAFQSKEIALINAISNVETQKKALEEQSKALEEQSKTMREKLLQAMEQYGVKKFENDILSVTYVAPTTRTTIDSTKLKKDMPEIAEKYSKTSNVKASIKITVKD